MMTTRMIRGPTPQGSRFQNGRLQIRRSGFIVYVLLDLFYLRKFTLYMCVTPLSISLYFYKHENWQYSVPSLILLKIVI